jgi:hypothetical protein
VNLLVWRLHRNQVRLATGAFAVFAVLLLVTGLRMAHDYDVAHTACQATATCDQLSHDLFRGDGLIIDLVLATIVVPLLFGMFWGAPLVARELEERTADLAWTQSVPRRRWLSTTMAWVLVAAVTWGAAVSVMVTWWRGPENELYGRLAPGAFDIQGIVPISYALFAVALGIAAGSFFRRVLPAIATTLTVFAVARVPIIVWVRPHYLAPIVRRVPLASQWTPPADAWVISDTVARGGQEVGGPQTMPAACRFLPGGSPGRDSLARCLSAHGFRHVVTYQPGSRYWPFQLIEFGIFAGLALVLVGAATWWVLQRDA